MHIAPNVWGIWEVRPIGRIWVKDPQGLEPHIPLLCAPSESESATWSRAESPKKFENLPSIRVVAIASLTHQLSYHSILIVPSSEIQKIINLATSLNQPILFARLR